MTQWRSEDRGGLFHSGGAQRRAQGGQVGVQPDCASHRCCCSRVHNGVPDRTRSGPKHVGARCRVAHEHTVGRGRSPRRRGRSTRLCKNCCVCRCTRGRRRDTHGHRESRRRGRSRNRRRVPPRWHRLLSACRPVWAVVAHMRRLVAVPAHRVAADTGPVQACGEQCRVLSHGKGDDFHGRWRRHDVAVEAVEGTSELRDGRGGWIPRRRRRRDFHNDLLLIRKPGVLQSQPPQVQVGEGGTC